MRCWIETAWLLNFTLTLSLSLSLSAQLWWESCSTAKCDWRWGGNSSDALDTTISNFQVYDEMLRKLADKKSYPDLERVVLFGHSAGGQTYQRCRPPSHKLFCTEAPGTYILVVKRVLKFNLISGTILHHMYHGSVF